MRPKRITGSAPRADHAALLAIALLVVCAARASAAISIDVTTSKDTSSASSTIATPAFSTIAGNELLLAFISTDYSSGTNVTVTSVAGAGLAWALAARTNVQSGTAEIWRAFAPLPLTGVTAAATLSQPVASSITVMTFTGVDTSGTSGSGAIGAIRSANAASGAPTASVVTTRANSWVFGVGNDFDNAIGRTPGTGQSIVHQYLATIGDTYWVQRQNGATPVTGTTVTIDDPAPATDRYNLSIVEILPALAQTAGPDLAVGKTHSGNFAQGQAGATYTLTATNVGGAPTSGTVTMTDTLPAGLAAAGIGGTNWACTLATLTCTRNDALAAGASYPPVTVTVNVASNAAASVTNTATVSGGGDTNAANNTARDVTSVTSISLTGIKLIQSNVNGNESGTGSMSVAFTSNNTQGDFLIVTGSAARPASTLSVSDTLGNSYTPAIGPVTDVAQDVSIYIWYVPLCKGGLNTVTIVPSTTAALEMHISEWSGLATVSPVDQTVSATGTGTNVSSGPQITTVNGELIFGYSWVFNTASAGAGFAPISVVNGDLDEYQIQPTAGSIGATFTQASGTWFALMATFKPASSDTTPPTVSLTAPVNGAMVTGATTVSATASDNVGVAGVQFQLDGGNLGAEVTSAPYSVSWDTSTVVDGSHSLAAVARDADGNRTTSPAVAVTVSNAANPAVAGQWGAPFEVGLVAVNSVLLHTGKVLMFQGQFNSSGTPTLWDPSTNALTQVSNTFYNLFCAGNAQLPDGRILVMGGYDPPSLGASNANIFDPATESWSAVPNMAYRRWYPSGTTLPDGRILVTSGAQSCLTCLADVPEIYNPASNSWSSLTTARLGVPYYPFMYVLPSGQVVDAGANEETVATRVLDVQAGGWAMVDPNVTDGHSSAMYLPGRILKSGTAADSGTAGNAAATAFVIDMTQPAPAWRQVAPMAFPRAFQNTTILADGSVLVTGGGTTLDGHDGTNAVLAAELWSPGTETWTTLAKAQVPRLYHSTALLLPDGRVFSAGSGNDTGSLGGPAIDHTQAEIFSPPYLFKGPPPAISSAPGTVQYGSAFPVTTPDAASIASVSLVRLGAVTHAFNEDQRFLSLGFQASGGALTVQAPANANFAPPGYYMLFLVNRSGVPSVAAFVRFPSPSEDTIPPTAPTSLTGTGAIGRATLTWTASTDNTGVSLYNIYRSTTAGVQPTLANRIGQSTSTSLTDSGMAAGTYFYVATAQDVAGNISAPSNEASVAVLSDTTPPSVSMTAPAGGATVAGTVTVSASAADNVGVAGVQFLLDGGPLGAERTSPPYAMNWNTTATSNGPHTVSATARDAAGNRTAATPVNVTVSNTTQAPPGLVAAYGFNEGAGVQVGDASGQGNVGTIAGATWTANGKFGSALSFDGSTSWVTIADAPSLDLTTGLTIEAWVNPTSSAGWRSVVLKETSGGLAYALYAENNANRPSGYVHTNSDKAVNGTAALPLNAWTHLALTYDGATLRMFINGTQVRTAAVPGAAVTSSSPLRIGGNSVWGEYFSGLIDEVRIYSRALTATEIQKDMTTPVQ